MKIRYLVYLLLLVPLASCASGSTAVISELALTPYTTLITSTPIGSTQSTSTPLPAPSPTPVIHVVVAGDTVSGIALKYGVEIAAILAANPQVDPNIMSVGAQLIIPSPSVAVASSAGSAPEPLTIRAPNCLPSGTGTWCFVPVLNDLDYPVENITVRIVVGDAQSGTLMDQISTPPLNLLNPDGSIALAAYFSGAAFGSPQTSVELLSASAVTDGQARYLQTAFQNLQIAIDAAGNSALVNGEIELLDASVTASQVWLVAVAYDSGDQVVGVRRWESPTALPGGQRLPFSFQIYSASGGIARVEVLAEARR